jgi:antitoxin VapB
MGLNIKNPEVERLVAEVAAATGQSKTEAIRQAMLDRKEKLALPPLEERMRQIMEKMDRELLPLIPEELRGKPLTQEEQDEILGYGPDGHCV